MAAIDVVNRVLREFKRYTGDGLPGEPANAPLPEGDPQSGVNNPKKSELRTALLATLEGAEEAVEGALQAVATAEALLPAVYEAQSEALVSIDGAKEGAIADLTVLVDDAADNVQEAEALVQQATAGFIGFLPNQSYDFGSITDPLTYFNQDWGSL